MIPPITFVSCVGKYYQQPACGQTLQWRLSTCNIFLTNHQEVYLSDTINQLHSSDSLRQALAESNQRPVLIFKHSTACPISSRAFREFQAYLVDANPEVSYHLVVVQTDRPVSDEIAARLRLEHETPQAILVKNGHAVWNASHFAITVSALTDAILDACR